MGRHSSAAAYGHAVSDLGGGDYRLHWTVDRYYAGSRLRHPRPCHRDADFAGAVRFAKKHGCRKMPDAVRAALSEGER
jgi:hypothetical protein